MFINDPLGAAFHDVMEGKVRGEILVKCSVAEDEWLSPRYFFREFKAMPETEQRALARAKGRILDAGAGSGSHSLWLQEQGMEVTAIDVSPGAVEVMQRRGVKNAKLQNLFSIKEQSYDTILMLMNGIGMVQDIEGLNLFLPLVKNILKPGGEILLDSSDLRYLFQQDDGSLWIDLNAPYYGEVVYELIYGGVKGKPFKWLYIDFHTLDYYAQQHGFILEHLYEDDHFNYLASLRVAPQP